MTISLRKHISDSLSSISADFYELSLSHSRTGQSHFSFSELCAAAKSSIFQTKHTKSRVFCLLHAGGFESLHKHLEAEDIREESIKVENESFGKLGAVFSIANSGITTKYYFCEPKAMLELLKFYKTVGNLKTIWQSKGTSTENKEYRENFDIVFGLLEEYLKTIETQPHLSNPNETYNSKQTSKDAQNSQIN